MLTILFQFLIMRDMEKLAGAVRTSIIYFGAGIGGNLASAIFLPYHVEVWQSGSIGPPIAPPIAFLIAP